jgi:hypothetical protein
VVAFLRRITTETPAKALGLIHHDTKPLTGTRQDKRELPQRMSGGGVFSITDAPVHFQRFSETRSLVVPSNYKFSLDPTRFGFEFVSDGGGEDDSLAPTTWIRLEGSEEASEERARKNGIGAKIIAFLGEHPKSNTTAVRRAAGANAAAVTEALNELEQEGLVLCEPGDRNTKFWSFVPPGAPTWDIPEIA